MTTEFPLEDLCLGESRKIQRKPLLTFTAFQMTSAQNNQYIKVVYFGMASLDLLQDAIVLEIPTIH